jgi:hypothetical protein
MSTVEERDLARLEQLGDLLEGSQGAPIGDVLAQAIEVFEAIEAPLHALVAEEAMRGFRTVASRATLGTIAFKDPPSLSNTITDLEYLQLMRVQWGVHELCYAFEMVETSAKFTSEGSTSTRFYLNSIYHYVSSLFLVDTSKPSHKGLPMGGTVIRSLHPLGISELLDPIKGVLEEPFGETTFGDAIVNLRHSDLVHGDFSPARVEYLVRQTSMRNPMQQERFARLMWRLFHRLIVLHLKLLALLSSSGKTPASAMIGYLRSLGQKPGVP